MRFEINGFEIEIIDEPKHSHVVKWEQCARKYRNEDAKPELQKAFEEVQKISITESDIDKFVSAYRTISVALGKAIEVLNNNSTLTVSANHGAMVKAAVEAGWIITPLPDVDTLEAWKVTWIAEKVAEKYMEATTIPKN